MAVKQLVFSEEDRRRLQHGMDLLATAVVTTLGPKGRNVAIDRKFGSPTITESAVAEADATLRHGPAAGGAAGSTVSKAA